MDAFEKEYNQLWVEIEELRDEVLFFHPKLQELQAGFAPPGSDARILFGRILQRMSNVSASCDSLYDLLKHP